MEVFSDSAEHLLALTPDGSALTLGDPSNPTANGMYFNHISDYRNAGIGITNSRFTALFVSTLTPQTTGNHKFRLNSADDQAWIWLDLDQDRNLSSTGGAETKNSYGQTKSSARPTSRHRTSPWSPVNNTNSP